MNTNNRRLRACFFAVTDPVMAFMSYRNGHPYVALILAAFGVVYLIDYAIEQWLWRTR